MVSDRQRSGPGGSRPVYAVQMAPKNVRSQRKMPHGLTVTEHWQHAQALNHIDMSVKLVGRMKPIQS